MSEASLTLPIRFYTRCFGASLALLACPSHRAALLMVVSELTRSAHAARSQHPKLFGTVRPDGKTLSTFASLLLSTALGPYRSLSSGVSFALLMIPSR